MKAVFFYRADDATFTIDYPRIPRGLIKNGQRPYKVRFIGEDTNNRNILNWMKRCKLCVQAESGKRSTDWVLVDDLSDSPVSQDTQESIVALMTEKAKTDKVNTGMTLIPWHSILAIGKIFVEGLRYGKDNWKKGVGDKDYQEERLEHALTHFALWKEGDRSEAHLAKVAWFCVTQLELERLEQLQNPSPLAVTVEDMDFHNAQVKEIHYDQYCDALCKHFKRFVKSYYQGPNGITIEFATGDDLVLDYNKDHDQVAALPNIKLYTK